jgi:hypothetical protein
MTAMNMVLQGACVSIILKGMKLFKRASLFRHTSPTFMRPTPGGDVFRRVSSAHFFRRFFAVAQLIQFY